MIKKLFSNNIKRLLLILLIMSILLSGFIQKLMAQNSPVTTASVAGDAVPGQLVPIMVTVTQFISIGSISLSLDYDYSKLHYVSSTLNPFIGSAGNLAIGDNDLGNGKHRLILGWYGSGTVSVPDGSVLVTFSFTYISGSSLLEWFDNGASCSYTDGAANALNDVPYSAYYHNGKICGAIPDPGIITGPGSVTTRATGINYSVGPVLTATKYLWSVPPGAIISGGANTNSITVDYPAGSASGDIAVSCENDCGTGSSAILAVTVQDIPTEIAEVADNKNKMEFTGNDFIVFPNPALGTIFIKSELLEAEELDFSIISLNGTLIKKLPEVKCLQGNVLALNVFDIKPGIYFICVSNDLITVIKRIVIL